MGYLFDGYGDYFDRGPWVPFMRGRRTAGALPIGLVTLEQPAGAFPDPPLPDLSIQICTRGTFNAHIDMGLGRRTGRFGPGSTVVVPPDTAADYVVDGPHGLLVVAVPFAAVRPLLEEAAPAAANGDFGLLHDRPFWDPLVVHLCHRLWAEAEVDNPRGRLFAEGALVALVTALLRRSQAPPAADGTGPARPPAHIGRALDYLEAHLDQDVSLADLAGAAGLGTAHLARAFKRAMGVPPYRYLLQRRVERAKTLLAATGLPIAEVALECGFCHQEHLTNVFRRLTGTTPAAYRRAAARR